MSASDKEAIQWEITRIPIEEERRKLETETVYTTTITPKQTSQLLSFISKHLPKLDNIEHVKRVRKTTSPSGAITLTVILCQTRHLDLDTLTNLLHNTAEWNQLEIAISKVPLYPPFTAEQFEAWKHLWPVAFRPPAQTRLELTKEDRVYISRSMNRAMELAEESRDKGDRKVAVVACTPTGHKTIAESMDYTCTQGHPLRHAVMCCIGRVAEIEVARKSQANAETPDDSDSVVPAKRTLSETDLMEFDTAGYLCEGLDIFSSKEPCVMCCMALVHSRIGRLFFADESASGGISYYSIHSRKGLNHHFTAFQCSVPAEKEDFGVQKEL